MVYVDYLSWMISSCSQIGSELSQNTMWFQSTEMIADSSSRIGTAYTSSHDSVKMRNCERSVASALLFLRNIP